MAYLMAEEEEVAPALEPTAEVDVEDRKTQAPGPSPAPSPTHWLRGRRRGQRDPALYGLPVGT